MISVMQCYVSLHFIHKFFVPYLLCHPQCLQRGSYVCVCPRHSSNMLTLGSSERLHDTPRCLSAVYLMLRSFYLFISHWAKIVMNVRGYTWKPSLLFHLMENIRKSFGPNSCSLSQPCWDPNRINFVIETIVIRSHPTVYRHETINSRRKFVTVALNQDVTLLAMLTALTSFGSVSALLVAAIQTFPMHI